jgi:hypothetical protein
VPIESHHHDHIIDSGPQQDGVLDGAALDLYGPESTLSPGYWLSIGFFLKGEEAAPPILRPEYDGPQNTIVSTKKRPTIDCVYSESPT